MLASETDPSSPSLRITRELRYLTLEMRQTHSDGDGTCFLGELYSRENSSGRACFGSDHG
jgi:hypothetical protein